MSPKLKGKYAEVEVDDQLLGLTTDSIVVGGDEEVIEADIHSEPITQREVVGGAPFIEVPGFIGETDDLLEEAGIFDATTGEWTTSRGDVDVTVSVYSELGDADPAVAYEATECQPEWSDDLDLPEDGYAEGGVTFHVNGSLEKVTEFGA